MAKRNPICSVESCNNPVHGQGMCRFHRRRFLKHGDPLAGPTVRGAPLAFLLELVGHAESSCVKWPFSTHENGYGQVSFRGAPMYASRAMCILAHGEPPEESNYAAHSCGNGHLGCVHPGHLVWKSALENNADKIGHGTVVKGEAHHKTKLTEADVRSIRQLRGRMLHREIAAMFGVTRMSITDILAFRSWKWVK